MVGILLTTGCGSSTSVAAGAPSDGRPPTAESREVPTATSPANGPAPARLADIDIVRMTRGTAAAMGDASPEDITWVRGPDRDSASRFLVGEDAGTPPEDNLPVLVVMARGRFRIPAAPTPALRDTGSAGDWTLLYLTIDEAAHEVLDVAVRAEEVGDLASLGTPHEA